MNEKHDFVPTKSFGKDTDSCLKCGKTEAAHVRFSEAEPILAPIAIYFNKKLWKFNNWEEAKQHGFYLY